MPDSFLKTKKQLYSLVPILQKQKFPAQLGLLRMADLLARLNNPHYDFISVHIAGTAGKGSTTYLISKIMQETGLKVGLHISPHLQTMRERLQINGKLISKKNFITLINQIKPIVEEMDKKSKYGKPSYFEFLLAATFLYFSQQKVDLGVIETGMGGKYDGTNVLKSAVSVVTNIGLDHTNVLGKTKQTILKNKMQIIKSNTGGAITAIKQNYLLKIIKNHCQVKKIPLLVYDEDFKAKNKYSDKKNSKFDFCFQDKIIKNIKVNLAGIYQIENTCSAIAACLKLAQITKFKLTNQQIRKALLKAFFPGRMETISQNPFIILDGAHNEDKMKALVKSIKKLYPKQKFLIIFGVKKDKKAEKMLLMLKKVSDQFVLTQFGQMTDLGNHLNFPVEDLFKIAKKIMPKAELTIEKKSYNALKKGLKIAKAQKMGILLTGSLYLVGEARQFFQLPPNCKVNLKL